VNAVARVGAVLVSGAVAFAAVTIYALEGQEVVVLRTRTSDGAIRGTRTWVVDDGAAVLIEAAFPERPFFQDLLRNPAVDLNRHHEVRRYRAAPLENPDGHVRIRALLRDKYGWADAWVGMLQDTSRSLAVRLVPLS
jgi:hypothetical protein